MWAGQRLPGNALSIRSIASRRSSIVRLSLLFGLSQQFPIVLFSSLGVWCVVKQPSVSGAAGRFASAAKLS
jgi:hypothetical protein